MSVHGLNDYNDDDDVERGRRGNGGGGGGGGGAGEMSALVCGERIRISTLKPHQFALLCCCPCFLGPLCSSNRRTNYKNLLKTLSSCIAIVCIVMFIVEVSIGGFVSMKLNPMLGPGSDTLAHLGSAYGWRTQTQYELYRLFSPIFLHGGVFHLLGNMLFLIMAGVPLEQKWGWPRFAVVFFVSGIGASLFSSCINPNSISVGASGALFGLLGASLLDLLCHWTQIDPTSRRMQLFQQLLWIIIWMFVSFGSKYIDAWGHVGGLLFGAVVGLALFAPESEVQLLKKFGRPGAIALTAFLFLLLGGLFFGRVIATSQLFPDY